MRKLMWFSIGAAAACLIGAYVMIGSGLLMLALVCAAAAVALRFYKAKFSAVASVVLAGCVAGALWFWGFDAIYLRPAREYDGQSVCTQVQVLDYSYDTEYGCATDGRVKLNGKTYKIRFYSSGDSFEPGDVVEGEFTLRFTASGGEKDPTHHQGKSIFLLGNCTDAPVLIEQKSSVRQFVPRFRRNIQNLLDGVFPEDTAGFARALLLGDSSKLTAKENSDYTESGIRHIIAVSGLHVSILFSLIYSACGKRKALTAAFGIPVLILFATVAGFTPSIVRACVMQILMIIALLINKEYDPPTALSFSAIVILAVNPLAVTSVSFQLSVGCMVGIMLFSDRIHRYLLHETRLGPAKGRSLKARLIRWFVSSVSVTLGAMIVTTPLCAYHFGSVSLIGVVTNLVTLWVVSFIFYGIMAACALGAIWIPLGKIVAWGISWLIRYVQLAAGLLAKVPFAVVYTDNLYIVAWLAVTYILLFVLLLSRKKRPVVFCLCAAVCLASSLFFSKLENRTEKFCVSVLDVGQGQCVLLQSEEDTYLVDCGGSSGDAVADTVRQALLSEGIRDLDGVILTHYDLDHANGLLPLMEQVSVAQLYLPDVFCETDIKDQLIRLYPEKITMVTSDMEVEIEEGKLSIYAPEKTSNENDNSLCILFQVQNCDILITGDRAASGEKALIERVQLPDIEILVVGHHGSGSSTSLEFLDVTKPDIAVISAGKDNSFGHPAKETLLRLSMYGCKLWRTDMNGTLRFRG